MITNNKDECTRLRTLLVHNPEEFQNVWIKSFSNNYKILIKFIIYNKNSIIIILLLKRKKKKKI